MLAWKPEKGWSLVELVHRSQETLIEDCGLVREGGLPAARPVVLLAEVIVAGAVHELLEGDDEAVGQLQVAVGVLVPRLLLQSVTELEHPGLGLFGRHVKVGIQGEGAPITRVKVATGVLRKGSEHKPDKLLNKYLQSTKYIQFM